MALVAFLAQFYNAYSYREIFAYDVILLLPDSFCQMLELYAETPGEYADEIKQRNQGPVAISGVQLSMLPFTQMSFFTDKKQVQRSTTALGYIAHVCPFSYLTNIFF